MSSTRIHRPVKIYTQGLTEHVLDGASDAPYGRYKYNPAVSNLPGGLFHFVKDYDTYVPTLHGLSRTYIRDLKDVAVSVANSAIANRPFLNSPALYEVELINTGREPLRQGDRFAVRLPTTADVSAQRAVIGDRCNDPGVNGCVWGGLLATKPVNGPDCLEQAIQAVQDEDSCGVHKWISPYTPESAYAMMSLIANGGAYQDVPNSARRGAESVVNDPYDRNAFVTVLENRGVKTYLRNILSCSLSIMESVQGFASGQVIRSCNGYTTSPVYTGERFVAQLNMSRWLH